MGQVIFGLHTMEAKRWISKKEASTIKSFFGLNPNDILNNETYFFQDGIVRLWIEEVAGKSSRRYYLHAIVNFSRVLGLSNYLIMPYDTANVSKAVKSISAILKKIGLRNGNEQFQKWTVVRLDSAFDIHERYAELLMHLLNWSVNLSDVKRKCTFQGPRDKQIDDTSVSLRFGNASFVYNVYRKEAELGSKGKNLSSEERAELADLVRVERQNHNSALKKLLPNKEVQDLSNPKVRDVLIKTMIEDIHTFFGEGDYYSYAALMEKYRGHLEDIKGILKSIIQITEHSLMDMPDIYTKEVEDVCRNLGVSPVGIQKFYADWFEVDRLDGLYNRIVAQYPPPQQKRQYNVFPVPHKTADGRYKATITIYPTVGVRRQLSVAGKTLEEYEEKVFIKLYYASLNCQFFANSAILEEREAAEKALDSIRRFRKVVKTQQVQKRIDDYIAECERNNQKGANKHDSIQ